MNGELIRQLEKISPEEERILKGEQQVDRELYTSRPRFVIDGERLLPGGEMIALRTHTRFIPFPAHTHEYVEMMYVVRGSITHVIEKKELSLHPGDLLLLGPGVCHEIREASREDLGVNFIVRPAFFDLAFSMLGQRSAPERLTDLLRRSRSAGRWICFHTAGLLPVENLMENLIYSMVLEKHPQEEQRRGLLGLLLLYLSREEQLRAGEFSPDSGEAVIRLVLSYIDSHYQNASLADLCQKTRQSPSALSAFIHRKTGRTFQHLVQRRRFQAAGELLLSTPLTVEEIAALCGYENTSYFHRKFREIYGCSPREYRKS